MRRLAYTLKSFLIFSQWKAITNAQGAAFSVESTSQETLVLQRNKASLNE
jgi:hypothetical protein